jgi:hypothetical protein
MSRLSICKHCGIYDPERELCNDALFVHPETNDVSTKPKPGYFRGCACYIPRKVLNSKAKCPAGKW